MNFTQVENPGPSVLDAHSSGLTNNICLLFQVSQLSVSALLVWKSHSSPEVVRILFVAPNAHQQRVLVALEALHAGLPCLHQAEARVNGSTAFAARKPAGSVGARSANTAPRSTTTRAPGAPLHAPAKIASKPVVEVRNSRPSPSSGNAAAVHKTAPGTGAKAMTVVTTGTVSAKNKSGVSAVTKKEVGGGTKKPANEVKQKEASVKLQGELNTAGPVEPVPEPTREFAFDLVGI